MRIDITKEEQAIGSRNGLFWDFQIESKYSSCNSWFETASVPKELVTLCRICYNLDFLNRSVNSKTLYYVDTRN